MIHTLIIDFFSHGLRSVKIEQAELEKFTSLHMTERSKIKKKFEDTKGVIKSRKSKDRQHNVFVCLFV